MYSLCVFVRYYFDVNLFSFSTIATEKISLYLMLLKLSRSGILRFQPLENKILLF